MTGRHLTLAVTSSTGVVGAALGWVVPIERIAAGTVESTTVDGVVVEGRAVDGTAVEGVVEVSIATERRHAEELVPRLLELFDRAGAAPTDLDRLAVDVGPGRFTGLRVGLATVRALAFALDRPVVGLTSLEILAAAAHPSGEAVTAVVDARRREVFQQTFAGGRPVGEPVVGSPDRLATVATGVVVGDGVDRYAEHYAHLDHRPGHHPSAGAMLALTAGRTARAGVEVRPRYLRGADAVPNITTRRHADERAGVTS